MYAGTLSFYPLPIWKHNFYPHSEGNPLIPPAIFLAGLVFCVIPWVYDANRFNPNFRVMEKVQLVYAEVMNGVTLDMLGDPLVAIISDTGVFMVTTEENSKKYDEDFYPVSAEAREAYGIRMENGRVTLFKH